jgi:hypothetical protein
VTAIIDNVPGSLLALQWQNTISLGSVLITFVLGLMALGGIVYATVRKGQIDDLKSSLELAEHNAEAWQGNFQAEKVARERYQTELADEKVKAVVEANRAAEAEREVRHSLKNELASAKLELDVMHKMRDVSEVLQNQQLILAHLDQLNSGLDAALEKVVELLGDREGEQQ